MRGVAEEDLVAIMRRPLGTKPAGHVAAGGGGQPLDDEEPDAGADPYGGRGGARVRPRRHGGEAKAGAEGQKDQGKRSRADGTGDDRRPGYAGERGFQVRHLARTGGIAPERGVDHRLVPEQREKNDDRNRYPEHPKQNSAAHRMPPSARLAARERRVASRVPRRVLDVRFGRPRSRRKGQPYAD